MQTEEQKTKEAPKAPEPVEEEWTGRGLSPKQQERKTELLAKKAAREKRHEKPTKADQKELDELLAVEKAEHDRQAIIHKLASNADTYGRKEVARIRRTVTDRVKQIHQEETVEISGITKIYKEGRADLEREMKAAMQRVQEQHNKAMANLKAEEEKDLAEVRARYKSGYDQASEEIDSGTDAVAQEVSSFVADIQELELEQLQALQNDGILQNGSRKSATFIVVPGTPDKKPA
jgi:hypothetical protein